MIDTREKEKPLSSLKALHCAGGGQAVGLSNGINRRIGA
jgi:hypothetical protein